MSKSTSAHPTGGALISAGTLTSSALLLKLQTEREKREALEHEVDIIKRRLEERSVVQSAADYKQTLFSEMLHVTAFITYVQVLKLLTGSTVRDVSCRTYRRFHVTLTGIQAVASQSCCAANKPIIL